MKDEGYRQRSRAGHFKLERSESWKDLFKDESNPAVNAITNKVNVYKAKHLDATELPDELAGEIQFLKVKAAYQAGRERSVKDFMVQSKMKHRIEEIGTSISKYEEFAHYVEALVAYHKFHGGD